MNNGGVPFASAGFGVVQDLHQPRSQQRPDEPDHLFAVDGNKGVLDLDLTAAMVTEVLKGAPSSVAVLGAASSLISGDRSHHRVQTFPYAGSSFSVLQSPEVNGHIDARPTRRRSPSRSA